MVLQLNGGKLAFQIRQPARPIEFNRRFAARTGFTGVLCDKNSMNVSTCFCATTGKVSYLAIKVSLLMTIHAKCSPAQP